MPLPPIKLRLNYNRESQLNQIPHFFLSPLARQLERLSGEVTMSQGHVSEKNCSPLNVGVIVLQFVIVASPFGQDLLDIDT